MSVRFYCDWPAVFNPKRYNWVDFHFIQLRCEYEKAGPCFEMDMALLGFGVWFAFSLPWKTEQSERLTRMVTELDTELNGLK